MQIPRLFVSKFLAPLIELNFVRSLKSSKEMSIFGRFEQFLKSVSLKNFYKRILLRAYKLARLFTFCKV